MTLPIHTVTVLEDRAHVARRGAVKASPGSSRVTFEISPLVVDKTLFARVSRGAAQVNEVHVVRTSRLAREDQAVEIRTLAETLEGHVGVRERSEVHLPDLAQQIVERRP